MAIKRFVRRHVLLLLPAAAFAAFTLNLIRLHVTPRAARNPFIWENFRPLNLQQPVAANADASCPPRNIYIDAGANLANSMDWFQSAKGSPHPDTPWEVFSFELIPFNAHYTILQADFFNGDRSEPAPPLPTYSWDDEKSVSFDPSTAWGTRNLQRWSAWEEALMAQSSTLGPFERLLNLDAAAQYARMLEDGRCKAGLEPAKETKGGLSPKFHVYPVGVALSHGNFTVEWSSSNYLNGGSNLNYFSDHHKNAPIRKFKVHTVPFVHWIISSFRPTDYVFLKLDVEGAEFDILRGLFALGAADLIDEATIEFHSRMKGELSAFAEQERVLKWLLEASSMLVHAHF